MLEERNLPQEDLVDFGVNGTGELGWVQVIRLKRLKERLGAVLGSWGGSNSAGRGGTDGVGDSSLGNEYETSKLDLFIIGIVLRLSGTPKDESRGDDGGLKLLRPKFHDKVLSLGGGDCFDSSTSAEHLRLLTSFRLLERLVANTSPTIPQYATSACSNWAEERRKAVLIP